MADKNTAKGKLDGTKAPALPFAPVQYDRQYQDTLNNIMRQYFLALDNVNAALGGIGGGYYLSFPHIAAQDSTNQYATGTNVATVVKWDTLDSGVQFTLNLDSTASTELTGIYKIDYSLQFANTDSQAHDVFVWLHVDGFDVAGSTSKFTVPSKHGSVNGYSVAYSSVTFKAPANDKISLYWATNQAATAGGSPGVFMEASPAQTSPFAMPSTPSAIGSIVFVSGLTE